MSAHASSERRDRRRKQVRTVRIVTAISLAVIIAVATTIVATPWWTRAAKTTYVAYFANTNGLFVGRRGSHRGQSRWARWTRSNPNLPAARSAFSVDSPYPVPADARAAILSPSLVTARAIQLVPVYSGGPKLPAGSSIPLERTAVPVEWDDFRRQLEKLTESLQPTTPGGVNTLGEFINSTAANLRGQGDTARDTIIKLSQAISALGDHSTDIYSTVRNLQLFVSALYSSSDLLASFNRNLASATTVLANTPNEVADAVKGLDRALSDLRGFLAENREGLGVTFDRLSSITTALNDSRHDIKQALHVAPNVFQNFLNIYQPAQGALSGVLALNNFADTISFICGAIEAASRRGDENSVEAVRAVSGADREEPRVQLPAPRDQPVRRRPGPARRDHLQRGLAAARYVPPPPARSTRPQRRTRQGRSPPRGAAAGRGAPPPQATATDPSQGLAGLMVPGAGANERRPAGGHREAFDGRGRLRCLAGRHSGMQWQGLNSLNLPGTSGGGPGSYVIQAQLPDVVTIKQNSPVRVADVKVGNVTKIEVQDWHALVTMRIDGKVHLPANSTAKVGQTSLLGSMHIELAPPTDQPPEGELKDGSVIPLSRASTYPTTEQTLAAVSILLNGGGLGPASGDRPGFREGIGRTRGRCPQPAHRAGQVHRPGERSDRTTSLPRWRASTRWRASSPRRIRWSTAR